MLRFSTVDLFRKLPRDLTHGTSPGGVLSIFCALTLSLLFIFEFWSYLAGDTSSRLEIDNRNSDSTVRVNLDVDFPRLPCRYAKVSLWDYLGKSRLEVTDGVRQFKVEGEKGLKADSEYFTKEETHRKDDYQDLASDGEGGYAELLSRDKWHEALQRKQYAFVLFFVNWCGYCRQIMPQWEAMALRVIREDIHNVNIYMVDCDADGQLCKENSVTAYPVMQMYKDGKPFNTDYDGIRSEAALYKYLLEITREHPHVNDKKLKTDMIEGCFFRLRLDVNRVPGSIYFGAQSDKHTFDVKSTNTSHIIHHFSFGETLKPRVLAKVPRDVRSNINPLDGRSFINRHGHMSHEHYVKIVTTHYERGSVFGSQDIMGYQMSVSNHMYPSEPNVPEAKFSFDLSPTAVVISQTGRRWYEFLTSLCGIIGGTFTVFSLMDRSLYSVFRRLRESSTPASKRI